ncbi:hypothetical protein APHAL10511_002963 [Amanita phalloides]|nr:hypothetical protein APHAL10511_002963 [Amanita phalloides]
MAGQSSESTPRLPSHHLSLPIDDNIYQRFTKNHSIRSLELWKERRDPEHEFLILTRSDGDPRTYRVERRPSKGTAALSKIQGCTTEDTITCLDREYAGTAVRRLSVHFRANPKPELYNIFALCNAIRKDPDTKEYTLMQFNCYFFARTLALLITRHFLLRQYRDIHIYSTIKDDIPGPRIDDMLDKSDWEGRINVSFEGDGNRPYLRLRSYINEMDETHCEVVAQFGGNRKSVYNTLNRKRGEIWFSGLKEIEQVVSGKKAGIWSSRLKGMEQVVVKKQTTPSSSQTKKKGESSGLK